MRTDSARMTATLSRVDLDGMCSAAGFGRQIALPIVRKREDLNITESAGCFLGYNWKAPGARYLESAA